ncbi:MAG: hypothetical protein ILA44_04705, partial [Prevotella sp.]|nr:hypothetical protein [Prevotella sp.]
LILTSKRALRALSPSISLQVKKSLCSPPLLFAYTLTFQNAPLRNQIWSISNPIFNQKSGKSQFPTIKALLLETEALLLHAKAMLL